MAGAAAMDTAVAITVDIVAVTMADTAAVQCIPGLAQAIAAAQSALIAGAQLAHTAAERWEPIAVVGHSVPVAALGSVAAVELPSMVEAAVSMAVGAAVSTAVADTGNSESVKGPFLGTGLLLLRASLRLADNQPHHRRNSLRSVWMRQFSCLL